jgi:hypothetical protein
MSQKHLAIPIARRLYSINRQDARIWLLLLALISLFALRAVWAANPWNFDYNAYQQKYHNILAGKTSIMPDNDRYAWAGWEYVHGLSPEKFNFEHPPLAKYLIGFSEVVFRSQVALSVVFGAATLLITFIIGRRTLPSYYALLPPFLLAFDRLFIQFSATSMLDIYCTFFLSLYVLLFYAFRRMRWSWIPLGIIIGLSAASKWIGLFAVPGLALFAIVQRDKKALLGLCLSLPIAALTYTGTYGVYFLSGHSIPDFVSLQMAILRFQSNLRFAGGAPPLFWLTFNFLTGIEGPGTWTHIYLNSTANTLQTTSIQFGLATISFYNPFTWPLSIVACIFAIIYRLKRAPPSIAAPFVFLSFIAATSYGQVNIWYLLPGLPFAFIALAYMICALTQAHSPRKTALIILVYCPAVAVWSLYFQLPFIQTGP